MSLFNFKITQKAYLGLLGFLFIVLASASAIKPFFSYGDNYSDALVAIAGENFYNYGLKSSFGVPYYYHRGSYDVCRGAGAMCADTHYPGVPYWINFGLRKMGIQTLAGFRIVALSFTFFALLLLPFLYTEMGLKSEEGRLAALLMTTHITFLTYSDSIHQGGVGMFVLVLFLLSWMKFITSSKFYWFLLSWIGFFASTWITFEHFLFIPVFSVGSVLILKRFWKNFIALSILAFVPFITLGIRLWQHAHLFDSMDLAVNDLLHAATYRSQIGYLTILNTIQQRLVNYLIPIIPIGIFLWVKRKSLSKPENYNFSNTMPWLILLLVAPLSWAIAMKQHFDTHVHVMMWFGLFYGLGLFYVVMQVHRLNGRSKQVGFAVLIIFILMKMLSAPQWNKWVLFSVKEHQAISETDKSLGKIRKTIRELATDERIQVPAGGPAIAYEVGQNFIMVYPQDMCRPGSSKAPLILSIDEKEDGVYERCLQNYNASQELGKYRLFWMKK